MLHGWTGDESIMWIFNQHISPEYLIISPRGVIDADPSGFGWIQFSQILETPVEAFFDVATNLFNTLDRWLNHLGIVDYSFDLMGFSQGAALAYVLSILFPDRVMKTAALAGYLPKNAINYMKSEFLHEKKFFIAHGIKDEIIPFSTAEQARSTFLSVGANVEFCSSNIGHKLSAECTNQLQNFFKAV